MVLLALFFYGRANAQTTPVPQAYQDIYSSLNTDLDNFNATLKAAPGPQSPVLFTGNLKDANSNAGPQLVNPFSMATIQLQLQELKAMGVQAVMVQVGFPVLYEPFLTSQGQSYVQFVIFYQQIAASVRAAGLKLIVENDTLLTNDVQAGWDVAGFYSTLDWTSYQQARAAMALTVAEAMRPDYMVVLQEPATEAANSGQSAARTPSGSAALLSQILASVQQAGVPGMQVGAGTSTAEPNYLSYVQSYVALPVDFIDMHVYPINRSYLSNAMQIASTAAAAGKRVAMTECWLWKIRDNELNVLSPSEVRGRDPFSFWAPLDAYFIQTMQNMARSTQMLFMNPFGSQYFAAYLPYDSATQNLPEGDILDQESSQAAQNLGSATYSGTAMSYYSSLVPADTVPPSVPTGVTGNSANPNGAAISWNGASDDVGVAGYYVLRNGSVAGTTANTYYQDSGLTESTAYTYAVEAFDLAGNVSAPSLRISVTTSDVTPPTTPTGVTATANSSQRVTLTWSPSNDKNGIGSYLVFWGMSPGTITQVARTAGTTTSYTSYPLSAGTTYYYAVEAADGQGNTSAMSAIASATTPGAPSAPAALSATATSATKISLTWSAAANGGLPVQYYHMYRGNTASSLGQVAIVSQTSYTDNSVSPSTSYYYAVQAADTGSDLSVMSPAVSVTTPALPLPPATVSGTPASTSKLSLTWSPAVSGGLPIQNYHVYRGATSSNLTQVAVVLQTSYTDSNVSAGTTYYYAIAAADSGSDLSALSTIVPVAVPTAPGTPAQLVATPVSTSKINLTWAASTSGGLAIQYYRVFRGTRASNLSQLATVPQPAYSDSTGSPSTVYYYAVQAADTGNDLSPMSATVSATTLALPSTPANFTATAPSKLKVTLTWTASPSGMPLVSYTIFRGSSPSNLTQLKAVAPTQTSTNGGTVAAGTTYYYAIQAKDSGGNVSPLSNVVSVTTPH